MFFLILISTRVGKLWGEDSEEKVFGDFFFLDLRVLFQGLITDGFSVPVMEYSSEVLQ